MIRLLFLGTALAASLLFSPAAHSAGPSVAQASPGPAAGPDKKPPQTPPAELRELWTGGIYASSFRVGICIEPDGEARGVLLLRVPSGNVDVYHFRGRRADDGTISLRHPSGHSFTGSFSDDDTVRGTGLLKNGFKATLQGTRTHNAPLTPDTCRPLD